MKRKNISKKLRFEVFKRDRFKCQYCGAESPNVLLQVDHINPVSKGGQNDIMNLVTSCAGCNGGKRDVLISDDAVIAKQRKQIEELQSRREQMQLMMKWRESLLDLEKDSIDYLCKYWSSIVTGWVFSKSGVEQLKKTLSKYSLDEIHAAMGKSRVYLKYLSDGKCTSDSAIIASSKIEAFCYISRIEKENPGCSRVYYIRAILQRKFDYKANGIFEEIKIALESGVNAEELERLAKTAYTWSKFEYGFEQLVERARAKREMK